LREQLERAGRIHHDHLFFKATGEPIVSLQYPYVRWRRTLQRLSVRYRKPYCARHSSVSWNLMIGKNPMWVAKQHGHSIATMLRAYAAWTEGASEIDIVAIRGAMERDVSERFGTGFGTRHSRRRAKCSKGFKMNWRRERASSWKPDLPQSQARPKSHAWVLGKG
jgi:hypothetical protein